MAGGPGRRRPGHLGDARFATLREVWNTPRNRARLDEVRRCHASCVLMNCHYPPD